jgi:AcrR family transcriptional regulator
MPSRTLKASTILTLVAPLKNAAAKRSSGTVANPVGRPTGRNSDDTRTTILDVTEGLFAEGGYDGTSIRDIATHCNVQAAVIGYHFGTKTELFDAVVGRRAVIVNAARTQALTAELAARKGRPLPIEVLVETYVSPLLDATSHGDAGWRNFASLMGRLANSPRGTEMINQHYKDVAEQFMNEFRRSLPTVPDGRLVDGFLYMVSAMLFVCADTRRWEAMVKTKSKKTRDAPAVLSDLVPFVAGGFKALLNEK